MPFNHEIDALQSCARAQEGLRPLLSSDGAGTPSPLAYCPNAPSIAFKTASDTAPVDPNTCVSVYPVP